MRDEIRFRAGRLVYVAFSRDETIMGFGFPKEERAAMVASEPDKFMLPRKSEMRYNWVLVRLDAIDLEELRELVIDGWRMCVPKSVAALINYRRVLGGPLLAPVEPSMRAQVWCRRA